MTSFWSVRSVTTSIRARRRSHVCILSVKRASANSTMLRGSGHIGAFPFVDTLSLSLLYRNRPHTTCLPSAAAASILLLGVARIFSGGALFSVKKVDDLFLSSPSKRRLKLLNKPHRPSKSYQPSKKYLKY